MTLHGTVLAILLPWGAAAGCTAPKDAAAIGSEAEAEPQGAAPTSEQGPDVGQRRDDLAAGRSLPAGGGEAQSRLRRAGINAVERSRRREAGGGGMGNRAPPSGPYTEVVVPADLLPDRLGLIMNPGEQLGLYLVPADGSEMRQLGRGLQTVTEVRPDGTLLLMTDPECARAVREMAAGDVLTFAPVF
jgi:hypothetical protein